MKQEITAQVVMLPQDKRSNFGLFKDVEDDEIIFSETSIKDNPYLVPQHLYFTTDEPIQKGDWIFANGTPCQVLKINDDNYQTSLCWVSNAVKIVASTDPTLGLPAIPTAWIRDACVPSNGSIKTVRLETYEYGNETEPKLHLNALKLTFNNEVVIVDEPKPFTKEEFEYQLKHVVPIDQRKTWAKENWPKVIHPTKSVDQVLEDAAGKSATETHPICMVTVDDTTFDTNHYKMIAHFHGFKAGANWKAEQSANNAIEFMQFRDDHCTKMGERWMTLFAGDGGKLYTIQELYKLWLKTKENADN